MFHDSIQQLWMRLNGLASTSTHPLGTEPTLLTLESCLIQGSSGPGSDTSEWQAYQSAHDQWMLPHLPHPCDMTVHTTYGSQWMALHPPQPIHLVLIQHTLRWGVCSKGHQAPRCSDMEREANQDAHDDDQYSVTTHPSPMCHHTSLPMISGCCHTFPTHVT